MCSLWVWSQSTPLPSPTHIVEPTSTEVEIAEPSPTAIQQPTTLPIPTDEPIYAIILFIGDGMGLAHRTAAQWLSVGLDGQLVMDTLPARGMSRTGAIGSPITDSAAAATALATGQKTTRGYLGMDRYSQSLPTILELAQQAGWSVGLVTTTGITHATPAGFATHVTSRYDYDEIALQMENANVDVLLGGAENDFLPQFTDGCYPSPGEREDGRNLIAEAIIDGYTYVCTEDELHSLDLKNTDRLLGLFGDDGMIFPFQPNLLEMTIAAITVLSQNPEGFFLMVEAGQIDWAAHDNEAEEVMAFTLGLDAAVAYAQEFSLQNSNTLIIVTADHETGGMIVSTEPTSPSYREDGPFGMPDGTPFYINWTSDYHTAEDVPVTALGPWSTWLIGTYENTFIFDVMHAALTGVAP